MERTAFRRALLTSWLLVNGCAHAHGGKEAEMAAETEDKIAKMKREVGEEGLRRLAEQLPKDASGKPCCPACGSGTGKNGTSGLVIDDYAGGSWHCFRCGARGDVFDLVGITQGIEGVTGQMSWLEHEQRSTQQPLLPSMPSPRMAIAQTTSETEPDYTEGRERHHKLIAESQTHLDEPEAVSYLAGRGIDLEIARAHGLGYDPVRRRIVVPYPGSSYYHIDRDITGTAPNKYTKPSTKEVGPQPLWYPSALAWPQFFVVEGPLDGIAVSEHGYPCVALCGTASKTLVEACREQRYDGTIVLLADGDEPGWAAATKTAHDLAELGICVYVSQLEGAKDAAELWAGDQHVA